MSKKGTRRQHKRWEQRERNKAMLDWVIKTYGSLKAFRQRRRAGLPLPKVKSEFYAMIKLYDI